MGWSIVHAGRRLWAATKADAAKLAKILADETGKPVTVRPAAAPARPKAKAKPKAKPARRTMRRNPDPGAFVEFMRAVEIDRHNRRDYSARTKPKRLAKIGRGRGRAGGAVGGAGGAKFAVDAANRKEKFTLYRATRAAANNLAAEFRAAGYNVNVRET